jgi:hypothetical protein
MGAVDLDGQSIERRDFPIARRGYEPAAVDAHLRALTAAVAQLSAQARQGESMGAAAGTQVQGILDAAEAAATQIASESQQQAARTLQEARLAAQRTRGEAIAAAQAHLAAVAQAAAALQSRVEAMDADLRGLTETLRAGGAKLAQELVSVERDMASLYDAASGRRPAAGLASESLTEPAPPPAELPAELSDSDPASAELPAELSDADPASVELPAELSDADPASVELPFEDTAVAPPQPLEPRIQAGSMPAGTIADPEPEAEVDAMASAASAPLPADIDGARLIALNMALNGDSREATDRYLRQHFNLPEREKLIAEVYAAIEG